MSKLRNCPKCKIKVIDDEAKFCIECGAILNPQTIDVQETNSIDTIKVIKGQKVTLSQKNRPVTKIIVEIGWKKDERQKDFEIDAATFLLDSRNKLREDSDLVFYYNPQHVSGAVEYVGKFLLDNIEVERIKIDLDKISADVSKIAFTCTIDNADKLQQNFAQVRGFLIRIIDETDSSVLISYDQERNFSIETTLVVGELYKYKDTWKFNTIISGFKGGLPAIYKNFGVNLA